MSTKAVSRAPVRPQFGHRQLLFHGMIEPRGRPAVACVVRDLTSGGARLVVRPTSLVPARFRLVVEAAGFAADCEIIGWEDGNAMDVRFVGAKT